MTAVSNASFQDKVAQFAGKRKVVFDLIKFCSAPHLDAAIARGYTLNELCEVTGWKTNIVSARVSELCDMGLLKGAGVRGGQTVWVVAEEHEVQALKDARTLAKRSGLRGLVSEVLADNVGGLDTIVIKVSHLSNRLKSGQSVRIA